MRSLDAWELIQSKPYSDSWRETYPLIIHSSTAALQTSRAPTFSESLGIQGTPTSRLNTLAVLLQYTRQVSTE